LLAVAAFCGWFIVVRDRPSESRPLQTTQKPMIPPTTIDTSAVLPGQRHYAEFEDAEPAPKKK
jgi:hypothetical protein